MADFITMRPKFPDEALDYDVDWASKLGTGEAVASHGASTVRGSAVVSNEGMGSATKQVFWLSGGVALEDTLVKCHITTDSVPARTFEALVRIKIASPGD